MSTHDTGDVQSQTIASSNTLGQDDFLQLLVTELSNQDPLNPKADMDYFAQLAQFTNLEQTKELGSSLQRLEANSLIGKTVEIQLDHGQTAIGIVEAVGISAGKPRVEVAGGIYELDKIRNVISTANPSPQLNIQNQNDNHYVTQNKPETTKL